MATPVIDTSALSYFSPIFLFFLVFAIFFAFLSWSKMFGDGKKVVLHAFISVMIAFFATLFDKKIAGLIEYIIPWFVFVMIFALMVIMILKMFGVSDDNLHEIIKRPGVYWTIIIIALVILLGGLSTIFGEENLAITEGSSSNSAEYQTDQGDVGIIAPGNPGTIKTDTGDVKQNIGATFYHPKILGMLLVLLITSIGVRMLTQPPGLD